MRDVCRRNNRRARALAAGCVSVVAFLLVVPPVLAQAWVPPAGQGSVTVAAQGVDNTGHVLTDGSTIPVGKSRSASVYVQVDYALTDRISLSAGIPYVFAKYLGPPPPAGVPEPPMAQPVDVCYCWQSAWQDLGVTARFNLLSGSSALSSSVSIGVPSHSYGYRGEAVVGRQLREVRVALDAGKRLDVISPRLAVQGGYSYAMVQRVLGVPNNRSNASAEAAFQLSDRIGVHASVLRQVTHGGVRAGVLPPGVPDGIPWGEITTPELFREHDRLLRDNNWRVAGGLSYALGHADLSLGYVEFVGGSDTHAGRALTAAVSVPFHYRKP